MVDHVQRIVGLETRLNALDRATEVAKDAINDRLRSMNEFRDALNDAQNRMMPRNEYDIQHARLVEDIKQLNKYRDQMDGKANQSSVNLALVGMVVGWIFAIIGILLHFVG